MHLHWRQRPSWASLVTLVTLIATLSLMGCAQWDAWDQRQRAQALFDGGKYVAAIASLLPPPFNLIIPSTVLVAGHVAATCLRRGAPPVKSSERPRTNGANAPPRKKPEKKVGRPLAPVDTPPVA